MGPSGIAGRIRELLGIGLEELPGASIDAEIPFSDALLNRLIEERLAAADASLTVQVSAKPGDTLNVVLAVRGARALPSVRVVARVEAQPDLPRTTLLRFRWSAPGLGPLAMLAGPVAALFKALPQGVHVEGDRLALDVAELVRSRGFADVLPYLAGLGVTTREGATIVRLSLRTPGGSVAR